MLHANVQAQNHSLLRLREARRCSVNTTIKATLNTRSVHARHVARASVDLEPTLALLRTAGSTKAVPPEEVENALALLEKESKSPASKESISGVSQLLFSTSTKLRAFQYIPVKEDLEINLETNYIALRTAIGHFKFLISGEVLGFDASGVLNFRFKTIEMFLFGNKVWEKDRSRSPSRTYTFFYGDSSISAARSSAGGLSLLVRNA